MSNIQKAYNRGYRMGVYIAKRDGKEGARERGSLAHMVYSPRMKGLIGAYDRGYKDSLKHY